MKYKDQLRNYNITAGIIHFLLSLVILSTVLAIDSPFILKLVKFYSVPDVDNFAPALLNTTCNQVEYINAFNWLKCIDNGAPFPSKYIQEEIGRIKIWILLFIFEVVTSLSHFYLASNDYQYHADLLNGINPTRWREYSITNSLMIVSILSLSNVSDMYLILSIAFSASIMNYVGGFVYELLTSLQSIVGLDERRKTLISEAKVVILLLTWTTFILSIVYLFDVFFKSVEPLYDLPSAVLWKQFFNIILILNIGIVVCYSAFPIIHTLQHQEYYPVNIISIEKMYIIASMVAKTFLTVIVFVATIQRN